MAFTFCNHIQLGASLYITSDGTNTGTDYIATVKGTDAFLNKSAQDIRSLNGTVYTQIAAAVGDVIDTPIDITFPLLKVSDATAILAVINAYTGTPFTCVITGDPGTFTGTAKPANTPQCLEYPGDFLNGKLRNAVLHIYFTLT